MSAFVFEPSLNFISLIVGGPDFFPVLCPIITYVQKDDVNCSGHVDQNLLIPQVVSVFLIQAISSKFCSKALYFYPLNLIPKICCVRVIVRYPRLIQCKRAQSQLYLKKKLTSQESQ